MPQVVIEQAGDFIVPLLLDDVDHHLGMAAGAEYEKFFFGFQFSLPRCEPVNLVMVAWPGCAMP